MSMFDGLFEGFLEKSGDWIQITDSLSKWTVEDFPYITGVDEELTQPHCWKCVTVNKCWFVDKDGKRPQELNYLTNSLLNVSSTKRGLYHPNCHCKKQKIAKPTEGDIEIIIDDRKIIDFFERKKGLALAWGYTENDKMLFKQIFHKVVVNAYIQGEYQIFKQDKFGVQISILISLPGNREKFNKNYKRQTGFMVFPNGKIKNNTIIGGKW